MEDEDEDADKEELSCSRRCSSRLRSEALREGTFAQEIEVSRTLQCCACLLEIDTAGEDGELLAVLDRCQPKHAFHAGCILTWAAQENSCPQCKQRFSQIGIYGVEGQLLRVVRAQERDQGQASDVEEDETENARCRVCQRGDDEGSMLLCDGAGGRCNAAYHYYCVGLSAIPEGDWFCPPCEASRAALRATSDSTASSSSSAAPGAAQAGCIACGPPPRAVPRPPPSVPQQRRQRGRRRAAAALPAKVEKSEAKHEPSSTGFAFLPVKSTPVNLQLSDGDDDDDDDGGFELLGPAATPSSEAGATSPQMPAKGGVSSKSTGKRKRCAVAGTSRAKAIKAQPKEPCNFGGLCREMPKWISRQGRRIRVDLGGRGLRDAAVKVLADVVRSALPTVSAQRGVTVSVHLAGNELHSAGLAAFLESVLDSGLHVAMLDLERNCLGAGAAECLAKWCARQPGGPPEELYLSHNKFGDKGALELFRGLCKCAKEGTGGRDPRTRMPLWVEASDNAIRNLDELLDTLAEEGKLCLALDRTACGLQKCAMCQEANDGIERPGMHLVDILDQDAGIVDEDEEKRKNKKEEKLNPHRGQRLPVKAKPVPNEPVLPVQMRPRGDNDRPFSGRAQREDGARPQPTGARVMTEEPAVSAPRPPQPEASAAAPPAPARVGAAGHGQPRRWVSADGHLSGPPRRGAGARVEREPDLPTGAEERKTWAQSLGTGVSGVVQKEMRDETAPPRLGMWDIHQALLKQRQKQKKKRAQEQPAKQDAAVTTAAGPGNVAPPVQQIASRFAPRQRGFSMPYSKPAESHAVPIQEEKGKTDAASLTFEAWFSGKPCGEPKTGGRAQVTSSRGEASLNQALQMFVHKFLSNSDLWPECHDPDQRRLHHCCLRDQLCRKAEEKYEMVAMDYASWAEYLRTPKGSKRITEWLEKKVNERKNNYEEGIARRRAEEALELLQSRATAILGRPSALKTAQIGTSCTAVPVAGHDMA